MYNFLKSVVANFVRFMPGLKNVVGGERTSLESSSKVVYVVLARFRGKVFLESLQKASVAGNLEIISLNETSFNLEEDVVLPLSCSAENEPDAIDFAASYCSKIYPKCLPESMWIAVAPSRFVKEMGRTKRRYFETASAVARDCDGVIEVSRTERDFGAVSDLVFDAKHLPLTEYPSGSFPRNLHDLDDNVK